MINYNAEFLCSPLKIVLNINHDVEFLYFQLQFSIVRGIKMSRMDSLTLEKATEVGLIMDDIYSISYIVLAEICLGLFLPGILRNLFKYT